jgi:hypothetical protein
MTETAPSRPNLGQILVRLKLINEEQVRTALELQQENGRLFGECLLELGHIGEDDLSWALSSQLGLPFMNVSAEMCDPQALPKYPRDFLRRNRVLPLVETEDTLSVVLADPTDEVTVARLRRISGRELNIAVGTPSALTRALDDLLGPSPLEPEGLEACVEQAGGVPTLASPEITRLLDRALSEGASAIHLDPEESKVRVRFRVGGALHEGGQFEAKAMKGVVESLNAWLGAGRDEAAGLHVWSEEIDGEAPPVRATAIHGQAGVSVTIWLEESGFAPPKVSAGFEAEWERLDALLARPSGLIAGVAPTESERRHLLSRILGQLDASKRRAWVLVPEGFPLPKRLAIHVAKPDIALTSAFAHLEGVDVLAGLFPSPQHLPLLIEAADHDRLVVAVLPGRSALGLLARLLEAGVSSSLLAETFLAAIAQRTLPATRAEDHPQALAELLFVDDPLRRALQDGGRIADLRGAARAQGFVELAARARGVGGIDAALLTDLDRHRYLGEAA